MERILIIDENRGIYIPQEFFNRYPDEQIYLEHTGLDPGEGLAEIRAACSDPANEFYWEVWTDFINSAAITIDGQDYRLEEDADLWGIPIQWRALSPDGFDIRRDRTYKTRAEAEADCKAWLSAIITHQGYYSMSDRTRLPYEAAYAMCEFAIAYPDDEEEPFDENADRHSSDLEAYEGSL